MVTLLPMRRIAIATCLCANMLTVVEPVESATEAVSKPVMTNVAAITQELAAINDISMELNRRIRRLESMLEIDVAVHGRGAAMRSWRQLANCPTTDDGYWAKEAEAREQYFASRAIVTAALRKLDELDR